MTKPDRERPHIVVGVDGSPGSKDALRWAARLGSALDARIDAITSFEITSTYGWSGLPPYEPEIAEKLLTEAVDEVFGSDRPAGLRLLAETGSPAYALIQASHTALMVIVGSRGHGGFTGLLLGSVSAKVAEHAACPVLVVHGTAATTAATS
ncbi:MAG: universal stress protein [Jatrophihabitans sp.]|uniref:universal stress protein n=1 Tax=Jatrophihabitans sp. TaxID=1932789 RepID=UPI003F7DD1D8